MSYQAFPFLNCSTFTVQGSLSVQQGFSSGGTAFFSTVVVTSGLTLSTLQGQPTPVLTAPSISSSQVKVSTLGLTDTTNSTSVLPLYNQAGQLYFNGSIASGTIVLSNFGFSNLQVIDTLSTSSTFTNFVSSAQLQTSTVNLQDTTNSASILPLYNESGLLYFNGSVVGAISSNLGLSNLNLLDTLSTSSTFTNFVSAAQLQTSTLNLQDTTNSASILSLYNEGGSLYFNGSAVGGSISSNLGLSNLNLLDTLSTSSTFTNFISAAQIITSSIVAQSALIVGSNTLTVLGQTLLSSVTLTGTLIMTTAPGQEPQPLEAQLISSQQVTTSTLNLADITNPSAQFNLYAQSGQLYFNGAAVGGTAVISSNLGLSNLNLLDTLSTSSTFTNFVSAAQVQVSTLNLQDTTNSASIFALYNEGGLLYFNGSAVGGTAVISSNLGLSNLNLLDTLSTSSTFTNFVSAAQVQVSTLNLQDTTNSASIAALYNEGGLLYYNGSAVGGSISSNLGLSNLNLLDTLSTSSTFTNSISSANAFIDTISSMMVYGSTIVSEQMSSLSIYAGSGIVGQLDVSQANKVYLTPLTLGTGDNTILYYNSGTGEITYSNAPTSSSVSDQFSTLFTSSFVASTIQLNNGIIEIKPTTEAIAIGTGAGTTSQGSNSVAIGNQAGYMNQGSNCVAIGAYAGSNAQAARSIVINATGVTLNNTTEQSFVVKPVRNATSFGTQMNYDATSGEITYGTPSDSNLKENIATTSNYFDSLLKLRPVEYSFKEDVSSIRHIGFIAQEVQPLLPALVEQHNSTLYINYNAFHPMYITAFQSLQSTNQGLQQQLSGTQQQLQQQITENRTLIQTLFSTLNLSM